MSSFLLYYRIVKLTSPYINVLIIVGAIFFYVDIVLFGIDEGLAPFPVVDGLCQVLMAAIILGGVELFRIEQYRKQFFLKKN